jgi:hypothetical protein
MYCTSDSESAGDYSAALSESALKNVRIILELLQVFPNS